MITFDVSLVGSEVNKNVRNVGYVYNCVVSVTLLFEWIDLYLSLFYLSTFFQDFQLQRRRLEWKLFRSYIKPEAFIVRSDLKNVEVVGSYATIDPHMRTWPNQPKPKPTVLKHPTMGIDQVPIPDGNLVVDFDILTGELTLYDDC